MILKKMNLAFKKLNIYKKKIKTLFFSNKELKV